MSKQIREQIEKFARFNINESIEYPLSNMDDISDVILKNGIKKFKNSKNNNIICEASLNRLLDLYSRDQWAIITEYRTRFTKEENIKRNRKLRGILNQYKMGPHQLVGRWQECTLKDVEWDKCPKDKLVDTFERSYFVSKPNNFDENEFKNLMINLMTIDDETQDAIVYSDGNKIYIIGGNGEIFDVFSELKLNKIAQAYSRHVKKHNIPFIFEGMELPGSISGRMVMKYENIKYLV